VKTLSFAALFGRYGEDEFDSLGAYTPLPDAAHKELRRVRLEYEPGRCATATRNAIGTATPHKIRIATQSEKHPSSQMR